MTVKPVFSEIEVKNKLLCLKERGGVKTYRLGDAGIGKTLEDLTGLGLFALLFAVTQKCLKPSIYQWPSLARG